MAFWGLQILFAGFFKLKVDKSVLIVYNINIYLFRSVVFFGY